MSDAGSFVRGHHRTQIRVYYEDTDAAGIVYYANYLKFAERARTDALRLAGIDQSAMLRDTGTGFVVRHASIEFLKPASLDDLLTLETSLHDMGKASMTMRQSVMRNDELLVTLTVKIACVGSSKKPVAIPETIKDALQKHLHLS